MSEETRRPVLQNTPSSLAPQALAEQPNIPEAPRPLATQSSLLPEVVPGGGGHHEQPGLEVAHKPDSGYAHIVPESPYPGGHSKLPPEYEAIEKGARSNRRVCGLKRWIFFTILAVIIIAAIIAGVVGGVVGSRSGSSKNEEPLPNESTDPPAPLETTVPIHIAAVRAEGNSDDITVFRQDNNTEQFYMHPLVNSQWRDSVLIEGLDPPPSKNTSLTALQFPGSTTIQIFYTSANGTLFDAYGIATDGRWTMGRLARDTNYAAMVSLGSGLAASSWMSKNLEEEYGARLYYVDQSTNYVQELAYDRTGRWSITQTRFTKASSQSKIALAWVKASNFSYTDNQVLHVFYQDSRANLVHVPGYNGRWDFGKYSETLGTLTEGTYLAAQVSQDTPGTNNTLRVMWISQGLHVTLLRGRGASPDVVKGFNPKGTFGNPIDAVRLKDTRNLAIGATPGGAIAVAPHRIGYARVYYQSLQNPDRIVEGGFDDYWRTVGQLPA